MIGDSVRIMVSYDYCQFEVCLSSDEVLSLDAVDAMRKDAARLVDKAVCQYKVKQENLRRRGVGQRQLNSLQREVAIIKENFPASEWTPEQKAVVKRCDDVEFALNREYDYEDDWELDG